MIFLRNHKMALRFPGIIGQSQFLCCPLHVCGKSQTSVPTTPAKIRSFSNDNDPKLSLSSAHPIESSPLHPTQRISRLTRSEAQGALFNYLHYTRSLSFLDAEYISKNSPQFVQKLLSNIELEKDVSRSMVKFLMYNPINEFEPFFESVGLTQSELPSFLPRGMIFLSDDLIMLENFRALCNYGVLPSKIGKIFREAREIFSYENEALGLKLRYFEELGLNRSTVLKLVVCSPSLLIDDNSLQFVKFLEKLKELGIESASIGKYLSEKNRYDWCRILDTIEFLEKAEYGKEQMAKLFLTSPSSIFGGSGKKIYLLFGQLLKLGFEMNKVSQLFAENPQVLSPKCAKNLSKALSFLLTIGMEMDVIVDIVTKDIKLLCSCPLKGPKTVCKELNLRKDELCDIIREDPQKLLHLASKVKLKDVKGENRNTPENSERQMEKETFLSRLGFVENSEEMAKALKQFRGRGDQLQERFDCIVGSGLDFNVVSGIVKRAPMTLNQSKDVIVKKIEYLTGHLGYPLETLAAFPTYLCYDMEKINQRVSMFLWLKERGKVKPRISLSTMLACSDARFVKYFVDVHPEGPAMWESLKQSLSESR